MKRTSAVRRHDGRTSRQAARAKRNAMNDVKIARIAGLFGLACVALTFGQFPLWLNRNHPIDESRRCFPRR